VPRNRIGLPGTLATLDGRARPVVVLNHHLRVTMPRNLAQYVKVGKTGTFTILELLLRAAIAAPGAPPWLCTPNMPYGNSNCAVAEVAYGAERLYGSGDVTRPATTWQRGHRFFTTLREPVERTASEFSYFCVGCGDNNKFCSRMNAACVEDRTNFTTWVQRAPAQYVRRFSRFWPGMSYLHAYTQGFPGLPPVTMDDVERAARALTRESSLVIFTDELNTSDMATQRVALDRLRAWLGGNASRAARALENVTRFPHENAGAPETRHAITAAERRLVCELNWADCLLYERIRGRPCAC